MIKVVKKSDTRNIQLTIANIIISSVDNVEVRVMYFKNDNIEIMSNDEPDKFTKDLSNSFKNRHENNL